MVALINTALLRVATAAHGLRARLTEERGQDLLEYALLGGLIAAALIAIGIIFTPALAHMATGIGNCIDFNSATGCNPGP
jgi:Flp pilus assembly pilin Flp